MEKVQATNVRPGMVLMHNNDPHRVLTFTHRTPGKGNAVVQAKLRSLKTGVQTETRWMSTAHVEKVSVTGRNMDYLYRDGDGFVFMDSESYEQLTLPVDSLEKEGPWLVENTKVVVEFVGEEPSGIQLPKVVEAEIVDTVPGMKGATATGSPKPATLSNGVVVKVPQFIENGDKVRVDPNEERYLERA